MFFRSDEDDDGAQRKKSVYDMEKRARENKARRRSRQDSIDVLDHTAMANHVPPRGILKRKKSLEVKTLYSLIAIANCVHLWYRVG